MRIYNSLFMPSSDVSVFSRSSVDLAVSILLEFVYGTIG